MCIKKEGVSGTSFSCDITNFYRSTLNSKCIIVELQNIKLQIKREIQVNLIPRMSKMLEVN